MIDIWFLMAFLTFASTKVIHYFIANYNLTTSSYMKYMGLSSIGLSLVLLSIASLSIHQESTTSWPYQRFDGERSSRRMVIEHSPNMAIAAQSSFLRYGSTLRSVMGRDFSSTQAMIESLDKLQSDDTITAQIWTKFESDEVIVPVKDLLRINLSVGESLAAALGLHNSGTAIWNFYDGRKQYGPFGVKSNLLLTVGEGDAFFAHNWRLSLAEFKKNGTIPKISYLDHTSQNIPQVSLYPLSEEKWGIILPPRLALTTKYSELKVLNITLQWLSALARFSGFDETQWRHFFRFLLDYPLTWYQIGSRELVSYDFWLYHLGQSLAIFGTLATLSSKLTSSRLFQTRIAIISISILTLLFMGKNLFVVQFV